jgi:hypothetical protein
MLLENSPHDRNAIAFWEDLAPSAKINKVQISTLSFNIAFKKDSYPLKTKRASLTAYLPRHPKKKATFLSQVASSSL